MSEIDHRGIAIKAFLSRMVYEEPTRELMDEAADLIAALYDTKEFWFEQHKLMSDLIYEEIRNGFASTEEQNTPN